MRTDLSIIETASFPAVSQLVSRLASGAQYFASERSAHQATVRTMNTDTPIFGRRLWGEDQQQFAIVSGVTAICRTVAVNAHEFDIVYTGTANSGILTTANSYPNLTLTGQAVSEALLRIGTLVTSIAINTPVSGPVKTLFGGFDSNRLSCYYDAFVGNLVSPWALHTLTVERFARTLKQIVSVEPVIDGYDHPAEGFLREAFSNEPEVAMHWFLSALRGKLPPSLVADSLRLLGRITPADKEWRARIAAEGLRSHSAEVRDAAMQAIESWGDPVLASILMDHRQNEPRKWLRDYADQIIQDLTD
jgi:hypothetical protein